MILQAKSQDINHFLFEGFPGVRKCTMILALLHETVGADKIQVTSYKQYYRGPNIPKKIKYVGIKP